MIGKALMLFCLLAVCVSRPQGDHLDRDLDALIDEIFNQPTTENGEATDATVKPGDFARFGRSTDEKKAPDSTSAPDKDLDAVLAQIFGPQPTKSKRSTGGMTPATTSTPQENAACTSDGGLPGKCVPYYMCDARVSSHDVYIIDTRVTESPNSCVSFIHVCCAVKNIA